MINQNKNNSKNRYLLRFSPFFWRLGVTTGGSKDDEPHIRPIFSNVEETH